MLTRQAGYSIYIDFANVVYDIIGARRLTLILPIVQLRRRQHSFYFNSSFFLFSLLWRLEDYCFRLNIYHYD